MQKQKFLDVIFKIFLVFVCRKKFLAERCAANQKRLRTTDLEFSGEARIQTQVRGPQLGSRVLGVHP